MVLLGDLPGSRLYSIAYDVSADGSVIVGSGDTIRADGNDTLGAFYWTREMGMLNLQELLISQGVTNLDGWRLSEARAVSADGRTVVGTGVHDGRIEAFIATVPEPSTMLLGLLAAAAMLTLPFRQFWSGTAVFVSSMVASNQSSRSCVGSDAIKAERQLKRDADGVGPAKPPREAK
jgi:uncharacterized membrane protein